MKIVRYRLRKSEHWGIVEGDSIRPVTGSVYGAYSVGRKAIPLSEAPLIAPCTPSKIVAVGLNYRSHARELKMPLPEEPLLFMKPSTAVIGHNEAICCPAMSSRRVDYEGELAVVAGRTSRHVSEREAPGCILGYTCLNDVTARDLQKKDGQFTRSKSFDTFAPVGPCIETELDPDALTVETYLNGTRVQRGSTADLVFSVRCLFSFISRIMTLLPGDIIATGTPEGVGPLMPGDRVAVRIEGIGTLENPVVAGK